MRGLHNNYLLIVSGISRLEHSIWHIQFVSYFLNKFVDNCSNLHRVYKISITAHKQTDKDFNCVPSIYKNFVTQESARLNSTIMGAAASQATDKARRILSTEQDHRLLMVGLDFAGKTTILYRIKLREPITTMPTIGFQVNVIYIYC